MLFRSVACCAVASCFGALNGWLLVGAELPAAMSRAGSLPRWFAKSNARGVPVNALWLAAAVTAVFVLLAMSRGGVRAFEALALVATVTGTLLYVVATFAAWRVTRGDGRAARPSLTAAGAGALARASVLREDTSLKVVGLRYFNVYGPREGHKGSMASVAFHLFNQVKRGENPKLFDAYDGWGPGEQSRDFVHVGDVADVNLWTWHAGVTGIFNCGTGRAEPFRTVAESVIAGLGRGEIEYIPFPDHLKGRYQSFTQADLTKLRRAGYNGSFRDVATGTRDYVAWLTARSS